MRNMIPYNRNCKHPAMYRYEAGVLIKCSNCHAIVDYVDDDVDFEPDRDGPISRPYR